MLSKNVFIHLLFKVKPVSLRANGSISLVPHKRLRKSSNVLSNGQKGIRVPTERLACSRVLQGGEGHLSCQSLVDVPDLGEQRWELLVLEAEGENLFRVDAA